MRKGYITISNRLYTGDFYTTLARLLFPIFRPTHIEYRHWQNDDWYLYGVSEFFDELKEGEAVPQYGVEFIKGEDGIDRLHKIIRYNG